MAIPVCGQSAQKKVRMDIDKAKTYIKSGKDFDKAETLMTDLLKDSANHDNIKIYATWFDAVLNQYNAANEKLYLKQKYDTAAVYTLLSRMYRVAESLDSLDAMPDEKGRKGLWLKKNNYFKEMQFDWGEIVIFAGWIETIAGIF